MVTDHKQSFPSGSMDGPEKETPVNMVWSREEIKRIEMRSSIFPNLPHWDAAFPLPSFMSWWKRRDFIIFANFNQVCTSKLAIKSNHTVLIPHVSYTRYATPQRVPCMLLMKWSLVMKDQPGMLVWDSKLWSVVLHSTNVGYRKSFPFGWIYWEEYPAVCFGSCVFPQPEKSISGVRRSHGLGRMLPPE